MNAIRTVAAGFFLMVAGASLAIAYGCHRETTDKAIKKAVQAAKKT